MYSNKNLYACVNCTCAYVCVCLCVVRIVCICVLCVHVYCVYMCCAYMYCVCICVVCIVCICVMNELFVHDYQNYFSFIVTMNSDFNYQCIIGLMYLMVTILAKP